MKLLILGHSYVRDLSSLGIFNFSHDQTNIEVKYSSFPGANYGYFLKNPSIISETVSYKPDIVIVILGGNSILRDLTKYELFHQCRSFYQILRKELPSSIIVPAQIETRFYKLGNKYGALTGEKYRLRRNELNKVFSKNPTAPTNPSSIHKGKPRYKINFNPAAAVPHQFLS